MIFRCFEKTEDVKIVGFGHFRIRRKASRRGRNPQTGDSIEITARKVLTFKPSKGLKQRINSQTPALTTDTADKLYYRIGEVESITGVPAYVLRYWESEFKLLRPEEEPGRPAACIASAISSWSSASTRCSTTSGSRSRARRSA